MVGVSEAAECHRLRRMTRFESIAMPLGRAGVNAEHLVRALEVRIVAKQALEMTDPVGALAGLAVRNAQDAGPKRGADFLEDFGGARKRHTTHEIDASTGHCRSSLPQ